VTLEMKMYEEFDDNVKNDPVGALIGVAVYIAGLMLVAWLV
jgi:hypothetical protein